MEFLALFTLAIAFALAPGRIFLRLRRVPIALFLALIHVTSVSQKSGGFRRETYLYYKYKARLLAFFARVKTKVTSKFKRITP